MAFRVVSAGDILVRALTVWCGVCAQEMEAMNQHNAAIKREKTFPTI